ncbi:hypothetical protein DPMN_128375 [Dreissena polymorpha]|uniref:Uncharacterized protein n=1 Tax=Dreissena polymorpha TaxID=45954 RepID=A0A9D4H3S4_DREPO|nr:hypothetical protein DPMN_128375 [Dreissena polymorpha]
MLVKDKRCTGIKMNRNDYWGNSRQTYTDKGETIFSSLSESIKSFRKYLGLGRL